MTLTDLKRIAEAATPGKWTFEPHQTDAGTRYQHIRAGARGVADTYHSDPICFEGGTAFDGPEHLDENGDSWVSTRHGNAADATHIATFSPALCLALVAVAEAAKQLNYGHMKCTRAGVCVRCDAMEALAHLDRLLAESGS